MPESDEHIEITDRPRRNWAAMVTYLLLGLGIAVALVLMFLRLSVPLAIAAVLVCFMVAYMLLMAWVAEGKLDRRE